MCVGTDERDTLERRRRRQGFQRWKAFVIEDSRQSFARGEIFNGGGSKKSLAERTLRIGIDQQHVQSRGREMPRKVKASGTLATPSLLVDETDCRRHWQIRTSISSP